MFTITINTSNDAFDGDPTVEIARILRETADRVEGADRTDGTVRDVNGATVGGWTLDPDGSVHGWTNHATKELWDSMRRRPVFFRDCVSAVSDALREDPEISDADLWRSLQQSDWLSLGWYHPDTRGDEIASALRDEAVDL